MPRTSSNKNTSSANIGFEAKLWLAADKLRSNMDAAEYKHVVLGLIKSVDNPPRERMRPAQRTEATAEGNMTQISGDSFREMVVTS